MPVNICETLLNRAKQRDLKVRIDAGEIRRIFKSDGNTAPAGEPLHIPPHRGIQS